MSRFFKPTPYNGETKNQMWMSMLADGHDIFCDCQAPFAHLLDSIFPQGHADRHHSIHFIVERDYRQCHSGGPEEESHGIPAGGSAAGLLGPKEEKDTTGEEELDALLAAAAEEHENTR